MLSLMLTQKLYNSKTELSKQMNNTFADALDVVLADTRSMLIEKNVAYGDSALNPVRVFSKSSVDEQLRVRIDDKISRLVRGEKAGEDVVADLLGYLILLRIAQRTNDANENLDNEA